jgi:hypothetical protein
LTLSAHPGEGEITSPKRIRARQYIGANPYRQSLQPRIGSGAGFGVICSKAGLSEAMKEVLRTNDLVLLSYATHVLAEAGIEAVVFDAHMSAVEGSIGAFPRRLMVQDDEIAQALRMLSNVAITELG